MIKKYIYTFFVSVVFLLPASQSALSQQVTAKWLEQKFSDYLKLNPYEEVFLHTDRDFYNAGEGIWIKTYLVDRQNQKLSSLSNLVYVELLNAENLAVSQIRILTKQGAGKGYLQMPDSLGTGVYLLRAYTNNMKNDPPENYFYREIRIFNSLRLNTSFENLQNKISINNSESSKTVENHDGIKMGINLQLADSIEFDIKVPENLIAENDYSFVLFIQTNGNINYIKEFKLSGESFNIKIPKLMVGKGIHQCCVFGKEKGFLFEKYFYTPLNSVKTEVNINSDTIKQRQKIEFDFIKITENKQAVLNGNFSISVYAGFELNSNIGLEEFMVFGSEFGQFPYWFLHGKGLGQCSEQEINQLIDNLKSSRIDWEKIKLPEKKNNYFGFENGTHFIYGILTEPDQTPAKPGEMVLLCVPGKEAVFKYTRTTQEGKFSFGIPFSENPSEIIMMPENAGLNRRIFVQSSFSDKFAPVEITQDSVSENLIKFITRLGINYQVNKIYNLQNPEIQTATDSLFTNPRRFYGKPDIELKLSDYISLPLMEEVFFEILPNVSYKKKKDDYEIIISDRVDNKPVVKSPCLMIDGVVVSDASLIINLNPEMVEKIEVIKDDYVVGKYLFPGIVNVITKAGDFKTFPLPDYMVRISNRLTDKNFSFVSPSYTYGSNQNRLPDYRNTIYWEPDSESGRIAFWTPDIPGNYTINIQGFTNDGQLVSMKKIFTIK
ncbi:MAG: hypothetical protein U0W24_26385 [Bacteroidales bacterium]